MYSAQHHETVDTRWVSFREEQERQRLAEALQLVAFLKASADVEQWRKRRKAHVEEDNIVPFEVWRQQRLAALPAPRQTTGAIQRVSEPLPSARPVRHIERAQLERTTLHEGEDEMPAWARPGPERQSTGAMEALAALAAQKPDDHTVPALEAIKLKHEKKESE